jgi:hypothetical protein
VGSTRRLILLAMSAAVLMVFAMPAAAQAQTPNWYLGGSVIRAGEEYSANVTSGSLTFRIGGYRFGPCSLSGTASLSNHEPEIEKGVFEAGGWDSHLSLTSPGCPVYYSFGGTEVALWQCEITSFTIYGSEETVSLSGTEATLDPRYYRMVINGGAGCVEIAPKEPQWTGSLTGEWENTSNAGVCFNYVNSHLTFQFPGDTTVNGKICLLRQYENEEVITEEISIK